MKRDPEWTLVAAASSAWRPRDRAGQVAAHPAFLDLDAAGRERLHRVVEELRVMEAGLDAAGLSATGRAVLGRIRGGGRA